MPQFVPARSGLAGNPSPPTPCPRLADHERAGDVSRLGHLLTRRAGIESIRANVGHGFDGTLPPLT